MSIRIRLHNVETCFTYTSFPDDQGKYRMSLKIPKGSDNHKLLKNAVEAAFTEAFEAKKLPKCSMDKLKDVFDKGYPIKDGDILAMKSTDKIDYSDFKDHIFIGLSPARPFDASPDDIIPFKVYDRKALPVDQSEVQSSDTVNILIELYAYFNKFKGVATTAISVQKVASGNKFRKGPEIPFDPILEDDEFEVIK